MQALKRQENKGAKKHWFRWIFLVLIWLAIYSLFKGQLQTRRGFLRLEDAELRLEKVREENEKLKQKAEFVGSKEYKEALLREKLNMQRSGEILVVLPDNVSEVIRYDDPKEEGKVFQKWLELLWY